MPLFLVICKKLLVVNFFFLEKKEFLKEIIYFTTEKHHKNKNQIAYNRILNYIYFIKNKKANQAARKSTDREIKQLEH